jgi:hypothetical protein
MLDCIEQIKQAITDARKNVKWIIGIDCIYVDSLQNKLFINWHHTESLFGWYLNFTIILHVQNIDNLIYHVLQVFIYGLYSTENNHNMVIGRLVKSISIDPNYYKSGSGRRFITGEQDEWMEGTEVFEKDKLVDWKL